MKRKLLKPYLFVVPALLTSMFSFGQEKIYYIAAENFNTAKQLGADDFLTKPVDFTVLKEKLKTIK